MIEDPSSRDRVTLIIKIYDFIRGHKFTPIANLEDLKIKEIVNERINWYNSVD